MRNNLRRSVFQAAGVTSAVTVALGCLATGAARADQFVELPPVSVNEPLSDGSTVTVTSDDSAVVSPSMGSTPLHRNVWVSGNVEMSAGASVTGGRMEVGYIIGCQVAFGAGAEAGGDADFRDTKTVVNASAGAEVTLGPGEVARYSILHIDQKDDNGDTETVGYYKFDGNTARFTYADKTFGLSGCAGYAQARLYANVTAYEKGSKTKVTIYGQPFSIG